MDILLISNDDTCRSRIAQELLNSFGRGMKITTAGILEGNGIQDIVYNLLQDNGHDPSRKKPCSVATYANRSWDYVITLCKDAEEELKYLTLNAKETVHFRFDDPFTGVPKNEIEQRVATLYKQMFQELYEFYRSELSEQLLPKCTCGANTYCRCE